MRRKIQPALPDEKKGILKGMRWILLRNREELSTEEESRLTEVLALHPELR
ncbi:MAG: transposase [Candidatus Electrothrix aestuarii]|uniref:Transposase n=1 Tax=Candidatus Electrothrix aestuarii TaxID=3062594 RepID=A0AAU8LQV4_9BACT|nr:transposase [Candidatus Electrothrix aestuarii]